MATIGYARVSTDDQTTALQLDALRRAGCEPVFTDEGFSGKLAKRPNLDCALAALQPGDTLVVWKLDRLGRSLAHLLQTITDLRDRGVGFRSLTEGFDTTTAQGRLFFQIVGAFAEFERELICERTQAGLAAAKRRGTKLGRRRSLTPSQVEGARAMLAQEMPVAAIARAFGVSRPTMYRALEQGEMK